MYKKLNSANIKEIFWRKGILEITFSNNTSIEYLDIPEGIAVGMGSAKSAGSYMNRYIVNVFNYKKSSLDEGKEMEKLKYYRDTTESLWVTDIESAIPEDKKHLFWRLTE